MAGPTGADQVSRSKDEPVKLRFQCVVVLLLAVLAALPAHARRLALVIGNDDYQQFTRLDKAGNDAEAMAKELDAAGFEARCGAT
jgi:hypothetical protein